MNIETAAQSSAAVFCVVRLHRIMSIIELYEIGVLKFVPYSRPLISGFAPFVGVVLVTISDIGVVLS